MARVKGAMMTRKRRNKTLKLAKSYWGSKSRHFKMAKQAVAKSGVYAYVGRKLKKREFRQLWISRISAAVAPYGIFPLHERPQEVRHRDEPQGPVRAGYHRRRGLQGSRRDREESDLIEKRKATTDRSWPFSAFCEARYKIPGIFRLCVGVDAHIDPAKRTDFTRNFGEFAGAHGEMCAIALTRRELRCAQTPLRASRKTSKIS